MPENASAKISNRQQVDSQQYMTSTPNLKVVSNPVDAYVKPAPDSETTNIIDTLKTWNQTTLDYGTLQEKLKKENQQQGVTDARLGKDKNAPTSLFNSGYGYNEAYDVTDGEHRGNVFQTAYEQLLKENNYFVDAGPDAVRLKGELYTKLYNEHMSPIATNEHSLFGASEHVIKAKEVGDAQQAKALFEKREEVSINNNSASTQTTLINYAKNYTPSLEYQKNIRKQIGESDYLLSSPATGQNRDGHTKAKINDTGTVATKIMTGEIPLTKKIVDPVTKQEVEVPLTPEEKYTRALNVLGVLEQTEGDGTNVVNWYEIKNADGTYKYRTLIDEYKTHMFKLREQQERLHKEELVKKQHEDELTLWKINTDPNISLQEKKKLIRDNLTLTVEQRRTAEKDAEDAIDTQKHIKDDSQSLIDLRNQQERAKSPAELDEIDKKLYKMAKDERIKRTTYDQYIGFSNQNRKDMKDMALRNKAENRERVKMGWDQVHNVVGKKSMMDIFEETIPIRVVSYQNMYYEYIKDGVDPLDASDKCVKFYTTSNNISAGTTLYKTFKELDNALVTGKIDAHQHDMQNRLMIQNQAVEQKKLEEANAKPKKK